MSTNFTVERRKHSYEVIGRPINMLLWSPEDMFHILAVKLEEKSFYYSYYI